VVCQSWKCILCLATSQPDYTRYYIILDTRYYIILDTRYYIILDSRYYILYYILDTIY